MVATVQQIIGKINPWLYAENGKELLKKYGSPEKIPAEEVEPKPVVQHKLVYDSSSETLEPIYFFILDLMENMRLSTEKLVDNFSSSPGSGHFSELGQRATVMQQQGAKLLGDVNTVLRSVLNIIYDLKEFKIRLQNYADARERDKQKSEAAMLTLKQIWLDKVDFSKGNTSIKAMAFGQGGYQTLIDAFLIAKDEKDAEKLDLNERVKRILKPRIQEFNVWIKQSEMELRKRYDLEKTYLKSQVNSLKLYSRWAKPYLKAAQQLEMKDAGRDASLVKSFNTILLELSILGKKELNINDSIVDGELPSDFKKIKIKREYFKCTLIDFKFRGIPQRVMQQSHYAFGGKADVVFSGYALNKDELDKLDKELDNSDIGDVLKLIEGTTTESLSQLQEEINYFLEEKDETPERKNKSDESNPLFALFGLYNKKEKTEVKKDAKKEDKPIRPDDWIEKTHLRKVASEKAEETTFDLFDIYKTAHGMPNYVRK